MANKLKTIDFSDGIYSDEIEYNFDVLSGEIQRERKNIGGPGIASGLEIEVLNDEYNFGIKLSEASIVTNEGEEIHLPTKFLNIDPPKLSKEIEYLTVNSSNQITLKHVPYSLGRRFPVQYTNEFDPKKSGIEIKYRNSQNDDDFIRVKAIDGKTLTLTGVTRNDITIIYHYTANRIDTVYLDDNYEIKTVSGITSPTPSAVLPPRYKYLIANIEIDPLYQKLNDPTIYAEIIMKKDLRKTRNLYTDKDGKLYICGIPFEDLQVINIIEPPDPKENDLWLDTYNYTLYIWKNCDRLVYQGQTICETNFDYNPDFKQDYFTDIYYYVGKDELKVYVNDVELGKDEFAEIINGVIADKNDANKNEKSKWFRIYKELKIGDKINYRIEYRDAQYMWIPINKVNYTMAKERKIFGKTDEYDHGNYFATNGALAMGNDENNYPYKYQYFFFHYDKDRNMLYTPGRNELSLLINQIPLHSDQFEEISFIDLVNDKLPAKVRAAAENYFGWDIGIQSRYNEEFDNLGIGFKLIEPLDVKPEQEVNGAIDLFVEPIIERRITDSPFKRKLQRSSTFVYEKTLDITDSTKTVIDIDEGVYYRYREKQLEVYLNGIRQIKDVDYLEGVDIEGQGGYEVPSDRYSIKDGNLPERARGTISRQFEIINPAFATGDKLTYRITTNIFSYDHINDLLNDIEYRLDASVEKVDASYLKTQELQKDMESALNNVYEKIEEIEGNQGSTGGFLTEDSIIKESQLPPSIVKNKVQSLDHINFAIQYEQGKLAYNVTDNLREEDFVVVIKRDALNQTDRMFIRDVDYRIIDLEDTSGYTGTTLNILSTAGNLMNDKDTLIVTGIKFGKEGR